MSRRTTATDRVRRVLTLVPWLLSRPEPPTVAETCARFDMTPAELTKELESLVNMVGVEPFTADVLFDVQIVGDRVEPYLTPFLNKPLRPDPRQTLTLLSVARAALDLPGADVDGPLSTALEKLTVVLAGEGASPIDVELPAIRPELHAALSEGIAEQRAVEIDHYSAARGEHTIRVVEPHQIASASGQWYLLAYCRKAGRQLTFRIDRVSAARVLDEGFVGEVGVEQSVGTFQVAPDAPRVELVLGPGQRWMIEELEVEESENLPDGSVRAVLPVGGRAFLERLLLRVGADVARRASSPGSGEGLDRDPAEVAEAAARRVLLRYCADDAATLG